MGERIGLGAMSPAMRHEMVSAMLPGIMSGAQASESPLAAFVAPIAASYLGGRSASALEAAQKQASADALQTVMGARGGPLSPEQLTALLGVTGDEMVSSPVRDIAKSLMMSGIRGTGGASGARRSSGGSSRSTRRSSGSPMTPARAADAGLTLPATVGDRGTLMRIEGDRRDWIESATALDGLSEDEAAAAWAQRHPVEEAFRRQYIPKQPVAAPAARLFAAWPRLAWSLTRE